MRKDMDLKRILFHVKGMDIDEAREAIRALPEGVLGAREIIVEKREPKGQKKEAFILNPLSSLFYLELPKGLDNIKIYRTNEPSSEENGEVTFDCGGYHYIIPALPKER